MFYQLRFIVILKDLFFILTQIFLLVPTPNSRDETSDTDGRESKLSVDGAGVTRTEIYINTCQFCDVKISSNSALLF